MPEGGRRAARDADLKIAVAIVIPERRPPAARDAVAKIRHSASWLWGSPTAGD
jgi:hypothetical protein